jgi:hypothetical protein
MFGSVYLIGRHSVLTMLLVPEFHSLWTWYWPLSVVTRASWSLREFQQCELYLMCHASHHVPYIINLGPLVLNGLIEL